MKMESEGLLGFGLGWAPLRTFVWLPRGRFRWTIRHRAVLLPLFRVDFIWLSLVPSSVHRSQHQQASWLWNGRIVLASYSFMARSQVQRTDVPEFFFPKKNTYLKILDVNHYRVEKFIYL
jgi:hypothetical protein